ncbi:MAG: 16S rRNA (guanine(966)-N(2))-methyltransferase RsmD [Bacteroidetes bacterium]|nr:16S rRNA (guanine(966)-N(2))-methyltransferase RsmD [Bacteroidota bacterium]
MRIISGTLGGRFINPPQGLPVRPTTDLAKTALFNMLASRMDLMGAQVLDLCCGTGNISIECASRGAEKVTAVDAHFNCVKFVNSTAQSLNIKGVQAFKSDVFKFIETQNSFYDFIFADPPYDVSWIAQISEAIFKQNILAPKGILIIEHGSKTQLAGLKNFVEQRSYGNVNFSIFRHHE